MMFKTISIYFIIAFFLFGAEISAKTITTATLLENLTDLSRLPEFPETTYTSRQFSSYNRLSVTPQGPGWFANNDGAESPSPGFEKVISDPDENGIGEYLVCDVDGPGAMLVLWQAKWNDFAVIEGTIKAHMDGKLFYEGPADEFFENPIKKAVKEAGIDEELFQKAFVQGAMNFYFPILFEKNCRIVWTGNPKGAYFYHVLFRNYPKAANVKAFNGEDLKEYKNEIVSVAKVLSDPKNNWTYSSQSQEVKESLTIKANQTKQVGSLTGPAAIEKLTLKINAENIDKALRQTVLRISFDDYPWGQVQAPVGDFFGSAPGINPTNTVPMTIEPDGTMTCRFLMPFEKSCKITIDNLGSQDVKIESSLLTIPYQWNKDKSMHFRARWRTDNNIVAHPFDSKDGVQDMPYLLARGKGLYVGSAVMVYNPGPVPVGHGCWWGEGDEKIFIDDDTFPSFFGTGTEDYYGYSFALPAIITSPYVGQSRNDGPANRGFASNYRWHISDPILFQKMINFYMELMTIEKTENFHYARIAYYYGKPGVMDDHILISKEDVRYIEKEPWMPEARLHATGSTFYQAEDVLKGANKTQLIKDDIWAGGQMLLWKPENKGDKISFALDVTEKGNYKLRITVANTPSSGVVSAYIDNRRLNFYELMTVGDFVLTRDLFEPYHTTSRTLFCPDIVELDIGQHKVDVVYEGKSANSKGSDVGIDFLWLQKQ